MMNTKSPEPPIKTFAALSFDVNSFAVVKVSCKPRIKGNIWTVENETYSNDLAAENKCFSYGLIDAALKESGVPDRLEILTILPNLDKKIGNYKVKQVELDVSTAINDALSLLSSGELLFSPGAESLRQELGNFSVDDEKHSHRVISLLLAISQPIKVNWLIYT
ncbi:MAG: hypothetical protein HEQ35_10800 [Gloeotrichia echinulata IR180]|jgi:hypothetical protein